MIRYIRINCLLRVSGYEYIILRHTQNTHSLPLLSTGLTLAGCSLDTSMTDRPDAVVAGADVAADDDAVDFDAHAVYPSCSICSLMPSILN